MRPGGEVRPGGEGSSGDPQSPGQSWGGGGTSLEHYPHPVAHSGTAAKDLNSVSRVLTGALACTPWPH